MRNKWFRRMRRFIELFTPGGTEYTRLGTEMHYSRFGEVSTPTREIEKLLDAYLDEQKELESKASVNPRPPYPY